jgi:hypothetical protein
LLYKMSQNYNLDRIKYMIHLLEIQRITIRYTLISKIPQIISSPFHIPLYFLFFTSFQLKVTVFKRTPDLDLDKAV